MHSLKCTAVSQLYTLLLQHKTSMIWINELILHTESWCIDETEQAVGTAAISSYCKSAMPTDRPAIPCFGQGSQLRGFYLLRPYAGHSCP
ncbi:hypothetical protein D3C81_1860430 [compost metagenome]